MLNETKILKNKITNAKIEINKNYIKIKSNKK